MGCYRSGRIAMVAISSFRKHRVCRISSLIGGVHVAVSSKNVDWLANVLKIAASLYDCRNVRPLCECDMMKKQIDGYGNDKHLLFPVT